MPPIVARIGLPDNMTSRRIILVEPSTTMRHALEAHVTEAGFDVAAFDNYADARQALLAQNGQFGEDICYVLLGWPAGADDTAARLLDSLCRSDYHDLPVLVLAQEMRPDSRAWVAARQRTRLLRWRDYTASTELMNTDTELAPAPITDDPRGLEDSHGEVSLLLVDESPAIRQSLSDLLAQQGYRVTAVATADDCLAVTSTQSFDLILLDYYIGAQTADELCEQILTNISTQAPDTSPDTEPDTNPDTNPDTATNPDPPRITATRATTEGARGVATLPIIAVLSSTWSDVVIRKSLSAGATECLYKSEPSDLLMARIEALARLVARFQSAMVAVSKAAPTQAKPAAAASDEALVLQRHAFKNKLDALIRAHRGDTDEEPAALLLVDIGYTDADGGYHPIHESPEAVRQMAMALTQVYRREHHVSWMGNSRFGIVLRQTSDSQSYLLTRKLMEIVNDIGNRTKLGTFSSNGALKSVSHTAIESADSLLQQVGQALNLVETRGRNNALLMDVKRLLPVYQRDEPTADTIEARFSSAAQRKSQ